MTPDLQSQLRALADKCRAPDFQLSKDQTLEATTLWTTALAGWPEEMDMCLQFAPNLPADSLAKAIASNWLSFDASLRSECINRLLETLPEASGIELRLRLAVALQPIHPPTADSQLIAACYWMRKKKKHRLNKEHEKLFRSVLLNDEDPALTRFALKTHTQADVKGLLACVSEVLFTHGSDGLRTFSSVEPRVIEWLLQNELFSKLIGEQRADAVVLIKSWPREAKATFASKKLSLPADLDEALRLDEASSQVVVEKESTAPPPAPKPPAEPTRNGGVHELLDQVGQAIKVIEKENKDVREELREKESAARSMQLSLRQTETKLHRAESELSASRAASDEKDSALQATQVEIDKLRGKLDASALELASEKEKHAADSQALLDRIDVEKKRAVGSFENRLAEKLRLEWKDFESVSNRPMDTKVGESLRLLVLGIFEMLEREGIKIRH